MYVGRVGNSKVRAISNKRPPSINLMENIQLLSKNDFYQNTKSNSSFGKRVKQTNTPKDENINL